MSSFSFLYYLFASLVTVPASIVALKGAHNRAEKTTMAETYKALDAMNITPEQVTEISKHLIIEEALELALGQDEAHLEAPEAVLSQQTALHSSMQQPVIEELPLQTEIDIEKTKLAAQALAASAKQQMVQQHLQIEEHENREEKERALRMHMEQLVRSMVTGANEMPFLSLQNMTIPKFRKALEQLNIDPKNLGDLVKPITGPNAPSQDLGRGI